MAGVRDQVDVNSSAGFGYVFSGRAHVVFHIAAAQHTSRIHIFKACEDLFWRPLCHIHDGVQPAAMRHSHDEFDRAALPGSVQDFIHQWEQRGHAFQRKTLGPQITLLQDLLEQVGADELVEDAFLVHGGLRTFHPFLYPLAPLRFGDVHEFHTDRTAVHVLRFACEFARNLQLWTRRFR